MTITLGFFDPHSPGTSPWAARVVGSSTEVTFVDPNAQLDVPAVPEPSTLLLLMSGLAASAVGKRLIRKESGRKCRVEEGG